MQEIKIDRLKEEEVEELSQVILEVFNEFMPGDFLEEGITLFKEFISPKSLKQRQLKGTAFTLVAKDGEKIIGTISLKDRDHIALFFVDKNYHGQGIGRSLFKEALDNIIKSDTRKIKKITVHAWPNSVDVYSSLGFKSVGEEHFEQDNGMVYLPMELLIDEAYYLENGRK